MFSRVSNVSFGVAIILSGMGCSEVEPCYDDMGNAVSCLKGMDMSDSGGEDLMPASDMRDLGAPADMSDAAEEMCVPKTSAEVCDGTCGEVSDGCGGSVQCGPCACEGGVPKQPVCGPCGLGKAVCDEAQGVTCVYPGNVPVETFTCDQIVYVDPKEPMGSGTKEMPFNSYAFALQRFASGEEGVIILSEGILNEPLVVADGVHVMAGYQNDSTGWVQDEQARVTFKPTASAAMDEDTFGMIATDLTRPTIVHGVEIEAPDAPLERSSYGAYVKDATFLTLDHVSIKAGRGGAGRPGQDGADGADGGSGGAPECVVDIPRYQTDIPYPQGGVAGRNMACPMADGGHGGVGTTNTQAGPKAPSRGADSVSGLAKGGEGGEVGLYDVQDEYFGHDGEHGPVVQVDMERDGQGGKATGEIQNDRWVAMGDGTSGIRGRDGSGGGGGGGAGDRDPSAWSMGGAGGGAGGCGGNFGGGGTGGGASIGLMILRSTVSLASSSSIDARSGGMGGRGGQGGSGGSGGEGGRGTFDSCGYGTKTWRSGHGGEGADGEVGGGGGGGAGGASVGAICEEGSLLLGSTSEVRAGGASVGGHGIHPGENGLVMDDMGCN